jgi:hypothetical protein
MGFDFAPYSGAVSSVSDLVSGVIKRIWPEKAAEIDKLKLQQEVTLFLATQEGQQAMKEYDDRADARKLAASDTAHGNALTTVLSAAVRPIWGLASLVVVAYPYLAGAMEWPSVTIDDNTKQIVQTVIMFYFGGRTIEKVLPLIKGAK